MKKSLSTWLFATIFLAGTLLLLYPTLSNWWNSFHQSRAVGAYVAKVADLTAQENTRLLEEALDYNKELAGEEPDYLLSDEELETYNRILDITGTGIMGYIDIPGIHVELPIYHGTDEAILQIAVGHIPGSSLPVGGSGTHSVLSGHRGLPSARLFTDIDRLAEGDTFTISVLDTTFTYEVDQIRTVLPNELDELKAEEGRDYCTLVTCTPYGVNTHRLLVRGHRVEGGQEQTLVAADAMQVDSLWVAGILGGVIVALFAGAAALTGYLVKNRRRRER